MELPMLADTASKIKSMEIRGAGRIARAAVLALQEHARDLPAKDLESFRRGVLDAASVLTATRPTAVSLPNAVHMVTSSLRGAKNVDEARTILEEKCAAFIGSSLHAVEQIGRIGAGHIRDGDVLMTHCNSEAALACILNAKREGREFEVFATEVRPRDQGRITIKILNDAGIRTHFIVDSAVRSFINEV
ncbi:MAG: ribose 1,5-bisphosphate isomerase, partial [Methanoregulaceae archaeon]|nr:ribose 1,5-bisphosphate isomerase [Methanoregulaceae archaeon]